MNTRQIALVSIGTSQKDYPYMPGYFYCSAPGIHYVNAILRGRGHETSIVNQITDNLIEEEIPDRIRAIKPDIVIFNQFFIMRKRVSNIIKVLGDRYIYGIGGHDATFHALSLIDDRHIPKPDARQRPNPIIIRPRSNALDHYYKGVDFIWLGEVENGFADFIGTIEKQKTPILIYNLHNRVNNLDDLPVLRHDDYNSEIGFIVGSRGCMTMGCEFCTTPQFYPDGWRSRSVPHMEEEINNIRRNGKIFIYASDDNFLGFNENHIERAGQIIEKFESSDIKCSIMTSVKQILNAEKGGYLNKWAGTLACVFIGVENPVVSSLKKFGKNVRHEESAARSAEAIEALAQNHIMPYLGYINFQPETTLFELRESARFLHDTNMEASCFHYLFNRLNMLEGTPLYNKFKISPLASYDIDSGLLAYQFNDSKVRDLWLTLELINNMARHIDCFQFETGILIYANKLADTPAGIEYLSLKNKINELNYTFFIETIDRIDSGDSFNVLMNAIEKYTIIYSKMSAEYRKFISSVANESTFITTKHISKLLQ